MRLRSYLSEIQVDFRSHQRQLGQSTCCGMRASLLRSQREPLAKPPTWPPALTRSAARRDEGPNKPAPGVERMGSFYGVMFHLLDANANV